MVEKQSGGGSDPWPADPCAQTVTRRTHAAKAELGRRCEDAAAAYLHSCGVVVLSRNWRRREGELDLVATDGTRLIVCEVKTRSGRGYGLPAEAVTRVKRARIRRLAYRWLSENHVGWCPVRFDVIAIEWPAAGECRLEHFEGAF